MTLEIEVWRGAVNAWQCDVMAHLNTRFYIAHSLEALGPFADALGIGDELSPGAAGRLVVRDQHVRFLREARAAAALHIIASVLQITDYEVIVLQRMYHSDDDSIAAVYQVRLVRTDAIGNRLPWPESVRRRADQLTVELPAVLAPRSLDIKALNQPMTLEVADSLNLATGSRGMFGAADVGPWGDVLPQALFARLADGMAQVVAPVRQTFIAALAEPDRRVGGAALECRINYLGEAATGTRFATRSALSGVDARTLRFSHWMFDTVTGRPLMSVCGVNVFFDLDARRIIPMTPDVMARLAHLARPELA